MSSRFLAASLVLLLLAGCEREARDSRGKPLPENGPDQVMMPTLAAGEPDRTALADPRGKLYEGNAFHVSEGKRIYEQFNCVGCHAHGGGGMGPALIDDQWRYGSNIDQIFATVYQGRPNGMPSFKDRLTEQQIWQVAAYVRAMNGQLAKDVVSSRGDEMTSTEPPTLAEKKPQSTSDPAAVQGTAQ